MQANKITKRYFGYRCQQRDAEETVRLFVFCGNAKDLINWIGIKRTRETPEGHQRMLRMPRTKSINYFLSSDAVNTIPNNILIAFDKGKSHFVPLSEELSGCLGDQSIHNNCGEKLEWGYLVFEHEPDGEESERPAFIVDGQHRLYGAASFKEEDLPILTVCLLEADAQEQAFQFIVINNKSVKVPTDNVKAIIANLSNEERLEERLEKAGVKYGESTPLLKQVSDITSSPFYNLLTWDYNRDRDDKILVPVTAIEQSLKYIQSTFEFLQEDQDSLLEFFMTIWTAIKEHYATLWNTNNFFMSKVNIAALNEYATSNLSSSWGNGFLDDIFDMNEVSKVVRKIFQAIPDEFWTHKPIIKIQDNANVKNLIKHDFDKIKENIKLKKNWKEELQVISATSIEVPK